MDLRVDRPGRVTVKIFNLSGQWVRTLVDMPMAVGNHRANWDGLNEKSDLVGNAVYFVVVETPSGRVIRKVIVLK